VKPRILRRRLVSPGLDNGGDMARLRLALLVAAVTVVAVAFSSTQGREPMNVARRFRADGATIPRWDRILW
jgi:hypothetical protein